MKRIVDLVVATVALIILLPVCAIVACAIWCSMGRPIFFAQTRAGLGGRPFRLIKFRTMSGAVAAGAESERDVSRITPLGAVIRRLSIDEIPQLYNVLRGDMSVIGPRPLLMEYLGLYSDRHARRHDVRPGVTGLAQVSGRSGLSWDERLNLDVWYVEHCSLVLDLKIVLRTLAHIVDFRHRADEDYRISERFTGSMHR